MSEGRNLSEEDVKAVAKEVVKEFFEALQAEAKNGLWNMFMKVAFTALIALAAWSAGKGGMGQ